MPKACGSRSIYTSRVVVSTHRFRMHAAPPGQPPTSRTAEDAVTSAYAPRPVRAGLVLAAAATRLVPRALARRTRRPRAGGRPERWVVIGMAATLTAGSVNALGTFLVGWA